MRLLYVTHARVPGRKAHCSQIAQMSRSFLNCGVDLELIIPARAELSGYEDKTIHGWYGFERKIPLKKIPCIDLLSGAPTGLPKIVYSYAFRLLVSTFNRSLVKFLRKQDKEFILYSRNIHVYSKIRKKFPSVKKIIELHQLEERSGATQEIENEVFDDCDGIIVVTTPMKDSLLKRGIDSSKILVELNGVDLQAFPGVADREEARRMLNLPVSGKIVLYAGNFHTEGIGRDFDTIVAAMPTILKKHEDTVFMFVGGPLDYAEKYISMLKDIGVSENNYSFLDRQPYEQITWWLGAADILVNLLPDDPKFKMITTTLKEFEYMTSNRPIVVSELPCAREVLINEVNALVIPPSDTEAFSNAILRLFDDPDLAERIANQAREDIQERTWDARAKRIKNWIDRLG